MKQPKVNPTFEKQLKELLDKVYQNKMNISFDDIKILKLMSEKFHDSFKGLNKNYYIYIS